MTWYEIMGALGCLMVLAAIVATCTYTWRSTRHLWREPRERTAQEREAELIKRQLRRAVRHR